MRPVIGISANISPPHDKKRTFSIHTALHLIQDDYIEFIETAGGIPLIIPVIKHLDEIGSLVERVDGIIISGGIDLDPALYGEKNRHAKGVHKKRDALELNLINEARNRNIPIFGICRGTQALNVALGGSLNQHIPTSIKDALKHARKPQDPETMHKALITEKSFLNEVFGENQITVNSSHHQSIKDPGEGLTVICRADDGVIEAVQHQNDFCTVGVQWHPERLHDVDEQVGLGRWFIEKVKETM